MGPAAAAIVPLADSDNGTILGCLLTSKQCGGEAEPVAAQKGRGWQILREKTTGKKAHRRLLTADLKKAEAGSSSPIFTPTTSPTLSGTSDDGSSDDEFYSFANFDLDEGKIEELDLGSPDFDAPLQLEPLRGQSGM
eukprot:COSAG06_NODE_20395_length_797_cov_1.505731_1_plen_136_part_01